MVKHLRQLISCLSNAVDAWDQFQQKEIRYFDYYSMSETASPYLNYSVTTVEKAFRKLKALRGILENLRKELCEENPQGVSFLPYSKFEVETSI